MLRLHHLAMSRPPTKSRRRSRSSDEHRERLERATELYLRACYETRTAARADEFAKYLRIARPQLSRIVPEIVGMPLRRYLRARQLAYAQRLLLTMPTAVSIDEIAIACAFGTPWTFYRCFRAAFGITPGEYRARRGRNT